MEHVNPEGRAKSIHWISNTIGLIMDNSSLEWLLEQTPLHPENRKAPSRNLPAAKI